MNMDLSSAKYFIEAEGASDVAIKIKRADWTNSLTVVCILCVMLGVWGLGTAAVGTLATVQGPDRQLLQRAAQRGYQEAQMIQSFQRIAKEQKPVRLAFYMSKFALSVALLSCVPILVLKPSFARKFAFNVFAGGIAFHIFSAGLSCWTLIAVSGQIEQSALGALGSIKNATDAVDVLMNGLAFGTITWTIVGMVVKGGIYVRLMLVLCEPFTRAIFAEDPYPEYHEMANPQRRAALENSPVPAPA